MTAARPDFRVLEDAIEVACHAPSVHNSQPWRWIREGGGLGLHLDTDRLVATDHAARQALLSCGAVLDHLRVAIAAAGWAVHVDRFPNPDDPLHLASVGFSPAPEVTDAARARAEAILRRRTDRLPFGPPPAWERWETVLPNAVDGTVAHLDVVDDADRPKLAEASQLSESLRLYDSAYHAELSWWTGEVTVTDGIPDSSLVSAPESDRVDIGRLFPVTRHRSERRMTVPQDFSKVLVLSTLSDSRRDVLACGETLSALLLELTVAGLSTCTLTHLTEVRVSRDIIAALVRRDFPQVLIRVGVAPPLEPAPGPTPRRHVADVLELRL
ncbi:putative NAD(P)H nitroreductase acg [Mycolicibacterium litorale]|uniref:Putative NAD(P)H nitroreductase acg n=1 Tax=Mycolicibacterium litorale TaxID=758802 RepID=A0A6S6P7V5_9MYCO|nr:NAD(P)H nitroreductase [Mycolicibacterium litorale]BCI54714.1 putative NAD(P)H nitroreductase acg [Mycolicibacterium litorale]